jgi:hypothetical protein
LLLRKDLACAYRAADELSARSIQALLEQEAIPVVLNRLDVVGYGGAGRMLYPNWGELLVLPADLERATQLIREYESAEPI